MAKKSVNSTIGNSNTLTGAPEIKKSIQDHLTYSIGGLSSLANKQDHYKDLALTVRDRLQQHWLEPTLSKI